MQLFFTTEPFLYRCICLELVCFPAGGHSLPDIFGEHQHAQVFSYQNLPTSRRSRIRGANSDKRKRCRKKDMHLPRSFRTLRFSQLYDGESADRLMGAGHCQRRSLAHGGVETRPAQ